MRLADGVSVCASGFRIGVHISCVAASTAIRHGTSWYFRGTMLPGWILNGGCPVPVDALGPGPVRGGRLCAFRKRWSGACTASADDACLGALSVGLVSPSFGLMWGLSPRFCGSFRVPAPPSVLVVSSWCLRPRRPLAPPAGFSVRGPGLRFSPGSFWRVLSISCLHCQDWRDDPVLGVLCLLVGSGPGNGLPR